MALKRLNKELGHDLSSSCSFDPIWMIFSLASDNLESYGLSEFWRCIFPWYSFSYRLSAQTTKNKFYNKNLSSEHQQQRKYKFRYFKRSMDASSYYLWSQSRWSSCTRNCACVQDWPFPLWCHCSRIDA